LSFDEQLGRTDTLGFTGNSGGAIAIVGEGEFLRGVPVSEICGEGVPIVVIVKEKGSPAVAVPWSPLVMSCGVGDSSTAPISHSVP
jgi:hypothetical protein